MNVYIIKGHIFHKPSKKDYTFSFPIQCQNKEDALQSLTRPDVQSVIKSMFPFNLKEYKKNFILEVWFNDRLVYQIEDSLNKYLLFH